MKKLWILALAVLLVGTSAFTACSSETSPTPTAAPTAAPAPTQAAEWPKALTIATMVEGSSAYVISVQMAEMWKEYIGINAMAAALGPSSAAWNAFYQKEMNVVTGSGDHVYYGARGDMDWTGKKANPRLFLRGSPIGLGLIARADSGITSFKDVKGKNCVFYNKANFIMNQTADILLDVNGLTRNDINDLEWFDTSDAHAMIKDGTGQCMITVVEPKMSSVTDLETSVPIRLIGATEEEWQALKVGLAPLMVRLTVPAGKFTGQDKEVLTFGGRSSWVCVQPELPDDLVYQMFKAIVEHQDELNKAHPSASWYNLENTIDYESWTAPVHPGVIKYLKEKGLWTDKHEAAQQEMLKEVG